MISVNIHKEKKGFKMYILNENTAIHQFLELGTIMAMRQWGNEQNMLGVILHKNQT